MQIPAMYFAPDGIRFHVTALASELFDIGPHHERAEELRRRIIALMRLARASAATRTANPADSSPEP